MRRSFVPYRFLFVHLQEHLPGINKAFIWLKTPVFAEKCTLSLDFLQKALT